MFTSLFIRPRAILIALCLALPVLSSCAPPPEGGSSSAPATSNSSPAETVALPYTADYLLFQDGIDADEYPVYGLTDKDKNVLLPAKYREISVSETGLIFASFQDGDDLVCQIFNADGSQRGANYSWLEYASTDADGNPGTFLASTLGQRPVPPYTARETDANGVDRCWILDESGKSKETEPYKDLRLYADGSIIACRDGTRFVFNADGSVETFESKVIATYFDGKYQVKLTYQNAWDDVFYALLDKDGNELAPPEYSRIQVPFEDRYVLYKGWAQTIDGAQAFLYNADGTLLADDSNYFGFITTPDSGYIGVSMVGNVFDGGVWSPESKIINDESGNPAPHGFYFVDRDGKRLGERYTYIDVFENADAEKTSTSYTVSGRSVYTQVTIRDIALETPVSDAYFRAIKQDGSQVKIPLAEKLIK